MAKTLRLWSDVLVRYDPAWADTRRAHARLFESLIDLKRAVQGADAKSRVAWPRWTDDPFPEEPSARADPPGRSHAPTSTVPASGEAAAGVAGVAGVAEAHATEASSGDGGDDDDDGVEFEDAPPLAVAASANPCLEGSSNPKCASPEPAPEPAQATPTSPPPSAPASEARAVEISEEGKGPAGGGVNGEGEGPASSRPRVRPTPEQRRALLRVAPTLADPGNATIVVADGGMLANGRGLEIEGHWGATDDTATLSSAAVSLLNRRVVKYVPPPRPTKVCRARLKNGALCPRRCASGRDGIFACPHHGPIVPRDACGNLVNPAPSSDFKSNPTSKEGKGKGPGVGQPQNQRDADRSHNAQVLMELAGKGVAGEGEGEGEGRRRRPPSKPGDAKRRRLRIAAALKGGKGGKGQTRAKK